MTVEELANILQDLITKGKGEYTVSLDEYTGFDVDVRDYDKSVRLW